MQEGEFALVRFSHGWHLGVGKDCFFVAVVGKRLFVSVTGVNDGFLKAFRAYRRAELL